MAEIPRSELISRYGHALQGGHAALFIGAGMSRAGGFVDWRGLMREIAHDLGLDVDAESDLIAVAQYCYNKYQGRDRLNQLLITEFTKEAVLTENHRLIASLPVGTLWTTNYDTLIEQSMSDVHKRLDVKTTQENFATTLLDRDATLYKMHGDISQPHEAVITKDDYETYHEEREAFSIALKGDLLEKTFLFLGFSFSDPNIDHILSRIRALLGRHERSHYCIIKKPDKPRGGEQTKHDYETRKLQLRVADLSRYGIHTVLIDRYEEVTEILRELQKRAYLRDIFVSGSAHDFSPLGKDRIDSLAKLVGKEIVARNYNLVSGFGLGLGGTVTIGALEERYSTDRPRGSIRFFPFPQSEPSGMTKAQVYTRFREEMLANVGFSIFLCGNRLDPTTNKVNIGHGVIEEFEITCKLGRYPIPVGATGHAAKEIWERVRRDPKRYYGATDVAQEVGALGDVGRTNQDYIEAIFSIIKKLAS